MVGTLRDIVFIPNVFVPAANGLSFGRMRHAIPHGYRCCTMRTVPRPLYWCSWTTAARLVHNRYGSSFPVV